MMPGPRESPACRSGCQHLHRDRPATLRCRDALYGTRDAAESIDLRYLNLHSAHRDHWISFLQILPEFTLTWDPGDVCRSRSLWQVSSLATARLRRNISPLSSFLHPPSRTVSRALLRRRYLSYSGRMKGFSCASVSSMLYMFTTRSFHTLSGRDSWTRAQRAGKAYNALTSPYTSSVTAACSIPCTVSSFVELGHRRGHTQWVRTIGMENTSTVTVST